MRSIVIKKILFSVLVMVLAFVPLVAIASTDIAIDATCRITAPDGSIGSGCVFEISQGHVYILTAAHVANASTATCEFWKAGHQSSKFQAQLVSRNESVDAAVLAVPEAAFGGILPRAIPVAPADCVLKPGDTIVSAGCTNGSWETSWKGHVLGYQGNDLVFTPGPADGRSGSAILDTEGKHIVAIVRARNDATGAGLATSVQALRQGLAHNVQCGPGGCQPSAGLKIGGGLSIGRTLPQPAVPQPPWPTLRVESQPSVDLTPTNQLLAQIAEQQRQTQSMIAYQQQQQQQVEPTKKTDGPNAIIVALLIIAALGVGGVIFFSTQSHTG